MLRRGGVFMISRTFGFLGVLASVMALSSLVYGAFQGPLFPYMQGIAGGFLDVYRLMRDYAFAGLGWTFTGLINLVGQWLTWLPPAPWFSLSSVVQDILSLYVIGGIAFWNFFYEILFAQAYRAKQEKQISWVSAIFLPEVFPKFILRSFLLFTLFPFWLLFVTNMILWEIGRGRDKPVRWKWDHVDGDMEVGQEDGFASERLQVPPKSSLLLKIIGHGFLYEIAIRTRQILRDTFLNLLRLLFGTALFFAIVYAENQIGL